MQRPFFMLAFFEDNFSRTIPEAYSESSLKISRSNYHFREGDSHTED